MTWSSGLLGLAAGLVIASVTAPVGVPGAVFLLPVQLSVLNVPSPAVTPANLLFNVAATPGALLRYRRHGGLSGPLTVSASPRRGRRAPGYTSLGFPDSRKHPYTPSADTVRPAGPEEPSA